MPDSSHPHGHAAHHAHEHDRGARAFFRYLRLAPRMWRSDVSDQVVQLVAPQAGERVVDLGAGMGSATVVAARSGATVIAVDPTPYMLRILRLRARWHRARREIVVAEGAAESIPLDDASVDALWTVNTLHHWTDKNAACRELARVLRPSARVVLVDEDMSDSAHPEHERARGRRTRHGLHFEEVDPKALADSLVAAGFASAKGTRTSLAGRPSKLVRAIR
jgi:ubiquinone/menaquinone biosynthesis C-methylase UbiE